MENITWIYKPFEELTLQELYDAMALRQEVFVIEQDCPYLDADGKDQHSLHLFAYLRNELVAYIRVVKPGISYPEFSIGRVVSHPTYRGKGYGQLVMKEGIKRIEQDFGKVPIRISAQTYLRRFYQSFGFQATGKEYLEDGIPHIEMIRETKANRNK